MEFFLSDQTPGVKMPILFSNAIDTELAADLDSTYYAAISLEMGKDQIMCEGPRESGLHIPASSNTTHNVTSSLRGYLYGPPIEIVDVGAVGDTSNQRITSLKNDGTIDTFSLHYQDSEKYYMYNLQDPAYQTYTPPYFYGKSSMVFSFTPDTTTNDLFSIFSKCNERSGSFYKEEYDLDNKLAITIPTSGSAQKITTGRMKIDASVDVFNNPVQIKTLGQNDAEKSVWYINPKWVCPVLDFSSSISAYEEFTHNEKAGSSGISGFSSKQANLSLRRQFKLLENPYHSASTGKSIWAGYGTDPYDAAAMNSIYENLNIDPTTMEKGIVLKVEDVFLENRRLVSQDNNVDSRLSAANGKDFFTERTAHRAEIQTTGSLLSDINLFDEQSVEIGRIAHSKLVSEAVVVIPYFEQPINFQPIDSESEIYSTRHIIPGKHFLPINKQIFENIYSILLSRELYDPAQLDYKELWGSSTKSYNNASMTDCGHMIKKMMGIENNLGGFQLPPEFDFLNNAAIDPFQMIVIPFAHKLHKQDLINIYQGVMPDISMRMEKQLSLAATNPRRILEIVDSNIYSPQIFKNSDGDEIVSSLSNLNLADFLSPMIFTQNWVDEISDARQNGLVPDWTVKDFYRNLKFMVFKLKQKAEKNYDTYKNRQIARAIKSRFIDQDPDRKKLKLPTRFDNSLKNRSTHEVYGTNWPYDYFSLIEAIKLDIEITM